MKLINPLRIAGAFSIALGSFHAATPCLDAATPIRLTESSGQDIAPAWDPRGNTIAYMRSSAAGGSGVPFDLYQLQATAAGESVMATGPTSGFGLANSPSWVGSTGLLGIEERAVFHEYLVFNSSMAPFTRTVSDGSDAAFTRILQVPGGGGGGFLKFSRNGSMALWRASTSGGSGTQELRVGAVSALSGQSARSVGTVLVSTFHSTEQRLLVGAALSPDGSLAAIALPAEGPNGSSTAATDIWLYQTDGSGTPANLTQIAASGIHNRVPDFSPDGATILFSRWSGVTGETWDLWKVNLDGTGLQQVTDTPHFSEYEPSWSPDGTRVAFRGQHIAGFEHTEPALPEGETSNANIYVMAIEGGGQPEGPLLSIHRAVELEWPTEQGVMYQVQSSTDLISWEDFGEPISGTGEPIFVFAPTRLDPAMSFRVVID